MIPITRRQFTKIAALAPFALGQALTKAQADIGKLGGGAHELTILYTNDFHSAFEPIPAYWLPGSPKLGGAAHLATLVEQERAAAKTSFLLDSGDMFTGTMSHLTHGEALMELIRAPGGAVALSPVPAPVAPTPVAPTPLAPTPVAPTLVAPRAPLPGEAPSVPVAIPEKQLYQFTDAQGVLHITDDLGSVPEKYRAKVTSP